MLEFSSLSLFNVICFSSLWGSKQCVRTRLKTNSIGDWRRCVVWRTKIFRPDISNWYQLAFYENVVRCFNAIQLVWNMVNMLCEFDCQTKSSECHFLDLPHFYSHLSFFSQIITGNSTVNVILFFIHLLHSNCVTV